MQLPKVHMHCACAYDLLSVHYSPGRSHRRSTMLKCFYYAACLLEMKQQHRLSYAVHASILADDAKFVPD